MKEESKADDLIDNTNNSDSNRSLNFDKTSPMAKDIIHKRLTLSHELFFKKLLRILGERIYLLCYYLNFKQEQMEFVWEIVKFILSEKIDVLINRHLDHIIICAIFAVSKKTTKKSAPKSFSQIFQEYDKLIFVKRDINQKNIELQGTMVNLKTFYNREFLEKTRVFIIQNAEHYIPPSEQDKPNPNSTPIMSSKKLLRQMNLDSPLVNTVPSLRHNAENSGNRKTFSEFSLTPKPYTPTPMTPMTRQLYAHDSPFERPRKPSLQKLPPKLLNFENLEDENNLVKKLKTNSQFKFLSAESITSLHPVNKKQKFEEESKSTIIYKLF